MVFNKGDMVTVFNYSPFGGNYFIEGKAKIIKLINDMGTRRYIVEFENGDRVERYIDPHGQANPEEYLKQLNTARG